MSEQVATTQRDDTALVRGYLNRGEQIPSGEYIIRETIVIGVPTEQVATKDQSI